jgi:hypothetical protein
VQHAHALVPRGVRVGERAGAVRRAVVDDEDVRVRERGEDRGDDRVEVLALVVRGKQDDVRRRRDLSGRRSRG